MACPGAVAEWLGRGLQSLVQRFESARRLERLQTQPWLDAHLVARAVADGQNTVVIHRVRRVVPA